MTYPERVRRARELYRLLRGEAPPLALRELLEAVLGLKCSRVDVAEVGMERLYALSVSHGFGMALASFKTLPVLERDKGDWSDHAAGYVDLSDPRGLYTVYLGPDEEAAETACLAEAQLGDDIFGELLGIPACCRAFYLELRATALQRGDDYLELTLERSAQRIPAGANILGQYFGQTLMSHFPCSLECARSREATWARGRALREVNEDLVDHLEEGHYRHVLVLTGTGMWGFEGQPIPGGVLVQGAQRRVGAPGLKLPAGTRLLAHETGRGVNLCSPDGIWRGLERARLVVVEPRW